MITCTRQLEFDAGHRVHRHESKCRNAHGHRYRILLEAVADETANPLDPLGRVIDFSALKDRVGTYIDTYLDHGFLCFSEDDEILEALQKIAGQKIYLMPYNPTAENIAHHFLHVICPEVLKGTVVNITKVTVFETPNCFAVATL
jgi:6-pyruvoyl-tetrahydropterin synthase